MADTAPEKDDLETMVWGILCGVTAYYNDWENVYGIDADSRERAYKQLMALWRMTHPETTSSTTEGDLQ